MQDRPEDSTDAECGGTKGGPGGSTEADRGGTQERPKDSTDDKLAAHPFFGHRAGSGPYIFRAQSVFAAFLNVGKTTVAAWEQGTKMPSGAASRLLELVDRKELDVLA